MAYSYAIEQAIRAASVLHKTQVQKGSVPYPYVTHLFAVAMIVSDYTSEEDTIVASLLHDTISDTDYTEREIEDDFGGPVKDIVLAITEPKGEDASDTRKQYVKQLKNASEQALIVVAADKIHMMRSIVEEYFDQHPAFIAEFGPTHNETLILYQEISNILNRNLKNDILSEWNSVFTEYKNFIHDVETKHEEY